jgi:maleate isomerase
VSIGPVSLSGQAVRLDNPDSFIRFGLIALATDLTSEHDFYRQMPQERVATHVSRVAYENPTSVENLAKMAPRLTDAAGLIAPGETLRAICYSCTAASVVIGDDKVRAAIQQARPGVEVVAPPGAALAAFRALGAKRISILTPYTVETSTPMAAYFAAQGLDVLNLECLGLKDDREMARVSSRTIIDAAIAAHREEAEAVFISCTNLPVLEHIGELEKRLGKPVVSSNQASAWAMARLAGLADHKSPGHGVLYDRQWPFSKASQATGEIA